MAGTENISAVKIFRSRKYFLTWGRGNRGSSRHGVICGQGSHGGSSVGGGVGSVGIGEGTVQQDLGLGGGRGESKNNLGGENSGEYLKL